MRQAFGLLGILTVLMALGVYLAFSKKTEKVLLIGESDIQKPGFTSTSPS